MSTTRLAQADVPVTYQLPATAGTYLVTLAVVDAKNPDWIISTFVAGQPRTVTAENGGKFTEQWDGLDENFMPVPPGQYAVKGIFAPAKQWEVDKQWHAVTPKWAGGASPWLPSPENWKDGPPFEGDPVNAPLRDVAVGPNGVAAFFYQYMENGRSYPMMDLTKPLGPGQFLRSFNSGGAGGGPVGATDGETVWGYSAESGPKYVFRTDGKSFGVSPTANRRNGFIPEGWLADMWAQKDAATGKSFVYLAQRGKMVGNPDRFNRIYWREDPAQPVNMLTVHEGEGGKLLATLPIPQPQSLAYWGDKLYLMHANAGPNGGSTVSALSVKEGVPVGGLQKVFDVPAPIKAYDMAMDSRGRFYLSDEAANKVYQLDASGKVLRSYGKLAAQKPGSYDPDSFMDPGKIAVWKNAAGRELLLVVDNAGPNRVSEWDVDAGTMVREFLSYQTKANNGYAIDPADASLIYLPGHKEWLTRFKVDYNTHQWKVDAVWPGVKAGQRQGLDKPVAIRRDGRLYLASEQNLTVYRLDGDRWKESAGMMRKDKDTFLWNDANDNGQADEAELRPVPLPGTVQTYHGQKWLADLSYIAGAQGGNAVWRLAPSSFDAHGNPVFTAWQKVFTDPIFEARAAGKADLIYGGNELTERYDSDWMQTDGSMAEGFYIQARGGKNFTANFGAQHKISRYVPTGNGQFKLKWRVGRTALQGAARRGEFEGAMRVFKPINGLLTVVDQSRSGLFLYTEDGLYVDTLFTPGGFREGGLYALPGEFFAGTVYPNSADGKVYYGAGKYTPFLYEMEGWSLKENPVRPITQVQKSVTISAAQIAAPLEVALSLRGGAGKARVARFAPALGGAALDGSLTGWEAAEPVSFQSDQKKVEVRTLYNPDALFLRWQVRLGGAFQAKPMPPLERIFSHGQLADTVSFYIQGDVDAKPAANPNGRPGDARFVFGLFQGAQGLELAGLGMYPQWQGAGAKPQVYRSPVGEVSFAHAGPIAGLKSGFKVDTDGKGFVIAVAIPRQAIPALKTALGGDLRTLVNFDATIGGHDRFWWANSDGSASRETYDEPSEARFYPSSWAPALFQGIGNGVAAPRWLIAGPFGGPGAEKFNWDPQNKETVRKFFEAATFPPDTGEVDFKAEYTGTQIQGYWPDPRKVVWKDSALAEMDTRVTLGLGSQVWYATTWVHSPVAQEMDVELQGHKMTYVRWFVNGERLPVADNAYGGNYPMAKLTTKSRFKLRQGWNQIFLRAYNVGYAPFKLGVIFQAPEAKLWPLRFSSQPQQGE